MAGRWFLVIGRVLGLGFFFVYTVPVTMAVCRQSIAELPGWQPVATLALVAAGWLLYLSLLGRRLIRSRRPNRPAG